jgi:hypothetical protein
MKRVINGKVYDTEKSDIIYIDPNKRRTYYMTKNGAFFVVYKTGELAVKTEEEIRELLGMYDYDKYVEIFGEPEEA